MPSFRCLDHSRSCQPPCEAVSWNSFAGILPAYTDRQPPCEAVSWNTFTNNEDEVFSCQPPCEAVSWNKASVTRYWKSSRSASLWGCELKYGYRRKTVAVLCQPPCEAVSWNTNIRTTNVMGLVSLLVRLWVEISRLNVSGCMRIVSLLVRLWVEIFNTLIRFQCSFCQPPCEAVSWNAIKRLIQICEKVSLLVRLWVEIPLADREL